MRARLIALACCTLLAAPSAAQDDPDSDRSWQSLPAGGSEQLTTLTDWCDQMLEPSPAYGGNGFHVRAGDRQIGGENPKRVAPLPRQPESFAAPQIVIFHGHGGERREKENLE